METLYVTTFVDEGRNTSIVGIFNSMEKAKHAVNDETRNLFSAEYAPIFTEDKESGSYFLIQKFKKNVVKR